MFRAARAAAFFGITGFTVNHEEWFGATTSPRVTETRGTTPIADLLAKDDALRMAPVEHVRNTWRISGAI